MLPSVTAVQALPDYRLSLTFDNGEHKYFDMVPYLRYPVFRRLQNSGLFGLALIDYGTVTWLGEIDIAPETLYIEISREMIQIELLFGFRIAVASPAFKPHAP